MLLVSELLFTLTLASWRKDLPVRRASAGEDVRAFVRGCGAERADKKSRAVGMRSRAIAPVIRGRAILFRPPPSVSVDCLGADFIDAVDRQNEDREYH